MFWQRHLVVDVGVKNKQKGKGKGKGKGGRRAKRHSVVDVGVKNRFFSSQNRSHDMLLKRGKEFHMITKPKHLNAFGEKTPDGKDVIAGSIRSR